MMKAFAWVILITLLSMTVLAADLQDTKIDYFHYREIAPRSDSIVYKIRITNIGSEAKAYELTPDTGAVKAIGTYRIDPSTKVSLEPGESKTLYFYLALEKDVSARVSIPLNITSGDETTTLELAAREIGNEANGKKGLFSQALDIALYLLLAIILIALLIRLFRKKKKDDESPEVETYY